MVLLRPSLSIAVLATAALAGCAGTVQGPDNQGPPDGGGDVSKMVPQDFASTVVLVNALTTDAIGDVRICPSDPKALAVPNNRPVALTNYAGVARGRGVDLGSFNVNGGVDVFSASAIKDKVGDCGSLRGGSVFKHVAVSPVVVGPSALVLVDDAQGVISAKQIALSVGAAPTSEQVAGQFAFAGTGLTATTLTLTFKTGQAQSGTSSSSPGFLLTKSFEDEVEVKDGSTTVYKQTLASIQYVSDPTTDPATFFDPRSQYLFVLVGDPKDPYTTHKAPEELTGRELHLTAVPFALVAKGSP